MKKTIIIISVILGIIAIGLGVYFAWLKTNQILTPPTAATSSTVSTPTIGQQPIVANQQPTGQSNAVKLKLLSDQPIFDYWIVASSTALIKATSTSLAQVTSTQAEIFYLNQDGQILKIKDGKSEAITSEPIRNIQSIQSQNNGKMILIKFGDLINPQFIIFNTENKIWQPLGNISAASLSPDNKKIAYLELNGDLIIKDLVGAKPKTVKILSINQKDFDLYWLNLEKILLVPKSSYQYISQIWAVDIIKKTLDLLSAGRGLTINWSQDNILGIQFKIDEQYLPKLSLIDNKGIIKANLDFSTFPDKCFISQPKIYCAIPWAHNLIKDPILPDDYFKKAVYYKDSIYVIDMNQNSFDPIFISNEVFDIKHLSLFGNKLFFINRYDNKLYSLEP